MTSSGTEYGVSSIDVWTSSESSTRLDQPEHPLGLLLVQFTFDGGQERRLGESYSIRPAWQRRLRTAIRSAAR